MKKTSYPIHPDFKRLEKVYPPLRRPMIALMQAVETPLYRRQRSTETLRVTRLNIPLRDGKSLRALLYSPVGAEDNAPCLVCFHGGGFVMPAAPYHYALARRYAQKAACKVLFVCYRLAPRFSFPIPLEDCFNAYLYALNHAKTLGIDENRIAVGGDSAGGNLAVGVCLTARERGIKIPCGQLLLYPALGFDPNSPSMQAYTDTPMCNARAVARFGELYAPNGASAREYLEPASAPSLAELPPAYIETAEFDCLRDGGILYAERLKNAGIPVLLTNTQGTVHAFDSVLKSELVQTLVNARAEFLKGIFN